MSLIWATRGRDWGFRFLRDGGHLDPLPEYDKAFAGVEDEPTTCTKNDAVVALRFPDPLGRRDHAGRVILHEFVLDGEQASLTATVQDGLRYIWPLVSEEYARIWDLPYPS